MIAYISGEIKQISDNSVLILCASGLGYEVLINPNIYSQILDKRNVELYIYQSISENNESLFGFIEKEDRDLFLELIKIPGIWWKAGINIIALGTNTIKDAILNEDEFTIQQAKWVGKKTASKILLELKDSDIIKSYSLWLWERPKKSQSSIELDKNIKLDVLQSLTAMGYNPKKVEDLLSTLPKWYESIDTIIPYIIKNI